MRKSNRHVDNKFNNNLGTPFTDTALFDYLHETNVDDICQLDQLLNFEYYFS